MFVVGVDLGTQSCKAVVCDDDLRVCGEHAVPIETLHPQPGWAEQDPKAWETAMHDAISHALDRANRPRIAALAIAGQLDGCIAVDATGAPLHRALIWLDRRAPLPALDRARLHAITGQIADPSHMAAKIGWLRAQGIRAARFHQPVSYLVERLTGVAVVDPSHASTTMLYDLAARTWSHELLAAFAIDPRDLPDLDETCDLAGELVQPFAGLPAGTPIAVGTGDDFATPLGAGLVAPGRVACVLGTAEVVGALAHTPILDRPAARAHSDPWRTCSEPMVETHAFPTGAYFVEHPGWLSGGAVRWATRLLGLGSDAELDALAASSPPGARGVTFIPALAGAMTPTWRPDARGALRGLDAAHDRADIARAVLEGLAFACRDVVERLAALGLATGEILALGGGAKSRVWLQLRADSLGRPHRAISRSDTCAIGAAMIALVAAGAHPDLASAASHSPAVTETFAPAGSLDEAYSRYRELVFA